MTLSLSENFKETLGLPEDARDWLLALWNVIQVFDDVADGDAVEREALDTAIFDSLVNMPSNPFFLRHAHVLLPVMAVQILKWKASDTAERAEEADERSYMWRAGFYEVVLIVCQLVHGQATAMRIAQDILRLYGEDYTDYLAEFPDA